jgi:CRISPR/Cas system CSM-associated protein Csm2 small subunit
MTTKPAPGEVLFHITDDTEFVTLRADDFRKGMLDRDRAIADLTRERDELRAAIEQTWRPEVTALRARNEELHRLYAEALARGDDERREAEDELRAEVERLRVQVEETAKECGIQKTENERLRAALTEIIDFELEGDASLDDAMRVADETLHPPA